MGDDDRAPTVLFFNDPDNLGSSREEFKIAEKRYKRRPNKDPYFLVKKEQSKNVI